MSLGWEEGRELSCVGSISVNSGISVECISSFCTAPAPSPQRLHDFGAPTAFRTLDEGQRAIFIG